MKKLSIIAITTALILLVSMLAPFVNSVSAKTSDWQHTLYVGTIGWGPMDADPVRAYDTSSGELIFNAYDTLIHGNQEKYWEFTPMLATNIPTRQTVTQNFVPTTFAYHISVASEEAYPFPLPTPVGTWWKDDTANPIDSMKIELWVDSNQNGILDASDMIFVNDYHYSPSIQGETQLWDACWFHVLDVQDHGAGLLKLVLERTINGTFDPLHPVDTWFAASPDDGFVYRLAWWIDNNPDNMVGFCDVVYMMQYQKIPEAFIKIGPGFLLKPVTCRAWHVTLADTLHLNLERFYYDFTITTGQNFVNETGAIVATLVPQDYVYTFQRGLIQDQAGSPQWMFFKPMFDTMTSDDWEARGTSPDTLDMAVLEFAYLINDAIYLPDQGTLRLCLGFAFPDNAWKQILTQTWAAIMSQQVSTTLPQPCWDGDLFHDFDQNSIPDWWETHRRIDYAEGYDNELGTWRWIGTGPYYVQVFDATHNVVILQRNTHYWRPFPADVNHEGYLDTVEIHYVTDDTTRFNSFIACDYDVCAIPRAKMFTFLDNRTKLSIYPSIESIANVRPNTAIDAFHFCFTLRDTTPYAGSKTLDGNGIPLNFFNNTYCRQAFAYAFNWSNYIRDNYFGEAQYRSCILPDGIAPDYYNKTYGYPLGTHYYYESLAQAQNALTLATFGSDTVWAKGFKMTIVYNDGNTMRQIACNYIKAFFDALSSVPGTHGSFQITVQNVAWNGYSRLWRGFQLPFFCVGWLADFADCDNFVRPYMNSFGDFCAYQNYSLANGWTIPGPSTHMNKDVIMDMAIKTPDGPQRAAMYNDLQVRYYEDCPSFPLGVATGRRWCKSYVRGWYYNGLYPSQYYYDLWKQDYCWYDIAGAQPTALDPGRSDGKTTVKDITYLIVRFNALPPDPTYNNALWIGTYGCGGVDPGPQGGDRICNVKDITFAVLHFNHATGP